jgi:dienelactone hydrolase
MTFFKSKKGKILIAVLASVLSLSLLLTGGCALYLADYYKTDKEQSGRLCAELSSTDVERTTLSDGTLLFMPPDPAAGFIFYPGGKVEYTAYLPLMEALAARGICCLLLKMPFNLAVFDVDAAKGLADLYPEIEDWYIGGHSLGGSMAASHLAKNTDDYRGLILLASYSTADLSESGLQVLSIYGTGDGVLNGEKYQQYRSNLPQDTRELVIYGGNHAQFGSYGLQDGDGEAAISAADQWSLTAEAFSGLLN